MQSFSNQNFIGFESIGIHIVKSKSKNIGAFYNWSSETFANRKHV